MTGRLLKKADAAAYLGMSEPSFDEHVRPYVVPRLIKRGPQRHFTRYDVRDLDAWVDTLPTLAPADAREEISCKNLKGSNCAGASGTSTRKSGSAPGASPFDAALASARRR